MIPESTTAMHDEEFEVNVVDHQSVVPIPQGWLTAIAGAARLAVDEQRGKSLPGSVLEMLGELEISLLDDVAIGEVHGRFMADPAPTDVITFEHGEILIGVETGRRQAAEHGEPLARELVRYAVHGVLHLAGHDDRREDARQRMEREQERIVAVAWRLLEPGIEAAP